MGRRFSGARHVHQLSGLIEIGGCSVIATHIRADLALELNGDVDLHDRAVGVCSCIRVYRALVVRIVS